MDFNTFGFLVQNCLNDSKQRKIHFLRNLADLGLLCFCRKKLNGKFFIKRKNQGSN